MAASNEDALFSNKIITEFTVAKIDHLLFAPKETVYPDLKKLCDTVSDSYRDRVVVELLQNAHDAHESTTTNGRIHMLFAADEGDWGALYVANDGNGFSEDNFRALCSPTRTTKTVNEAIGNKGVGFLSTFQVCAHPEIYSRASPASSDFDGFCFKFGDKQDVATLLSSSGRGEQTDFVFRHMPRLYLACPIKAVSETLERFSQKGYATVIRLPLKNEEAKAAVIDQLKRLVAGEPPVHLFLTRIAELTIERSADVTVLKRDVKVLQVGAGFRLQEVDCAGRRYILAQRDIDYADVMAAIRRDVEAQAIPTTWLEWSGKATVSLAVAMDGAPLTGRIYNFLPMGVGAPSPFAGHLDAPFYATIERLNIQSSVGLNDLFLATARQLAVEAARACRSVLKAADAQLPVIDLLAWTGEGRAELIDALLSEPDAIIPVLGTTTKPRWAALGDLRRWPDDEFLTPKRAAASSTLSVLDPAIGDQRLANIATFGGTKIRLSPDWAEKRTVAEGVAAELHTAKAAISTWDSYYSALARLFTVKPDQLLGLRILLSDRSELVATDAPTLPTKKKRTKRLSAMFLPPLRAGAGREELPRAVRQRLAYIHRELKLSTSSAEPARSMLIMGGLVREHQAREILRLLASAIDDTGAAANPEVLRWEALKAVMRISRDEEIAGSVIAELNLKVPGKADWIRADTAYFGRGWHETSGRRLEALFDGAQGISPELDAHARQLLRPFREWTIASAQQSEWINFLRQAGVLDHLRPVAAFAGPPPRSEFGPPFDDMRRRAALPADQTQAWSQVLGAPTDYPNPYTPYTVSGAYRLPGQNDFPALPTSVGRQYAEQVMRVIDADPSRLKMRLFRPAHGQRHERQIASPIEAFVRGASWVPTVTGLMPIDQAWIGAEGRTPPPGLPMIDYEFRTLMTRHENAETELRALGMPAYGTPLSAWKFLETAGAAVIEGLDGAAAERWLSAAQEAWSRVDLIAASPPSLRILCRSNGAIIAVDPRDTAAPLIIIADGDDRQLFAARMRTQQPFAIFDPPPTRLVEVAAYLERHFGARVLRVSSLRATYVAGGHPVTFDPADPLIEVELGDRLREIVALTVRYNNSFYRTDAEEVLQRLAVIRIRWLDGLSLQVGDVIHSVANFEERGVFLPGEKPTILVHQSLKGAERLLIKIAEALAEGLGSRLLLTNSIMAFAAQLDGDPLQSTYSDLARVLRLPEDQIRGALGVTRAAIGSLLFMLRPIVTYYCGRPAGDRFVAGKGLLTEDDIVSALRSLDISVEPVALVRRCRDASNLANLAVALHVNLARFNAVLDTLGAPYEKIDLSIEHAASLQIFLDKGATAVRNAIRATFLDRFDAGEDLAEYTAARDAARPVLPENFGTNHIDLPRTTMETWLETWFDSLGVTQPSTTTRGLEPMETVQSANLRMLRQMAVRMRRILLAKVATNSPLRTTWATEAIAQQALTAAAEQGGWADFDRLDGSSALPWLKRAGLWPASWPDTLDLTALDLDEAALDAVTAADEAARLAAAAQPRSMTWAGGAFRFGIDSWAETADMISNMAGGNTVLTSTTTRVAQGIAPKLSHRPDGGGGGAGGGPGSRMTQDERDFVGFCGEAIAFAWIQKRFGKGRVIDNSCWRSSYSEYVTSRKGDNSLGYDFEVRNGATSWYFEVKSTSGQGPQQVQSIELGSTEISRAESSKADGRHRFRILYVTDALRPEHARLFVLPNPRSDEGKRFFAEPATTGLRLIFGLPT